jgi:ABC-type nitrate/sulfonate/bicarbonate transport system substrate-binding protein
MFLRDGRLLRPYGSPLLDAYPEEAKERAEKGLVYWALARESYIGFTYNKTLVPKEAVPKNFEGLLNSQLKGKMGGVNRLGSTSDLGLRLALRKLGVDPEKDTKIITSGGNPERFAALSKSIVQFTIMPEPFVREAEKLGFKDLLDIGSLKIPFWWNAVLTREAIIKAKRPLLAKFARGMMEAVHFIKTEKEGAKAIFSKNLRITDPESLERAWKAYNTVFPENLMPTPDGVKTMLDDLAPRNPKAAAAAAKAFVDMSLAQEIEGSGFLKQLYKK